MDDPRDNLVASNPFELFNDNLFAEEVVLQTGKGNR
jgi:hypothetical protein